MTSAIAFSNAHLAMDDMQTSEHVLLSALSTAPSTFLQPPPDLHSASLACAKQFLDPLATAISEIHANRQKQTRRKRKRDDDQDATNTILRLSQLYCDGFSTKQIWEQARRVLDAAEEEVEHDLSRLSDNSAKIADDVAKLAGKEEKLIRFDEDGFEISDSEDESGSESDADLEEHDYDEPEDENDASEAEDESALEDDAEDVEAEEDESEDEYVADPNGLNDGFFDIDAFNKQTELWEHQDARGEPNADAESDEESIDWDADPDEPLSSSNNKQQISLFSTNADDEDEELSDINDIGGLDMTQNANDITYKDFFEPPPRKKTKTTRLRALPKTQPADLEEQENDVQRAMTDVHRDLFDDEDSESEGEDNESEDGNGQKKSAYEKQKTKIAAEIRRLEAANVAKKDWTLSGETTAFDRPTNALLEEDLDFEHVGKPLAVITNEVTEDIEAMIKRRILAHEFDELIRRPPESLSNTDTRRGHFELEDTKATKSLAELYEEDFSRATDPAYLDSRDEKLKKEHGEIEALWNDIAAKLDSLSNWHYKPKRPQVNINVISDAPTVSMEDARPTAGAEVGGASMLAPQEIYMPGEGTRNKNEVVLKSGVTVAKEEMTREEKTRRRRRGKERTRKKLDSKPFEKEDVKSKSKSNIIGDLKRGGVKVIDKKGDVKDIEGNRIKEIAAPKGAGSFKL